MPKRKLRALDLFSGCGGLTLGLKLAGFDVVGAIEKDAKAVETYRANHPGVRVIHDDIRNVACADLLRSLGLKKGEIDLVAGCPPCQGFSRIRTHNGALQIADPRNDLVATVAQFAIDSGASSVLLENVPGLARQTVWKQLLNALSTAGFELTYDVVDASDYGVPQRRRRLILLASRKGKPAMPKKCSTRVLVKDAFRDLDVHADDALHLFRAKRSEAVQRLIEAIPKNGGSRKHAPSNMRLACHGRTNGFNDVYGRMSLDDVSPTITSGCHNPSKGRFIHPTEDRAISLREAALLQGFPMNYAFPIKFGREAIALMIGNALPPPMIFEHARSFV